MNNINPKYIYKYSNKYAIQFLEGRNEGKNKNGITYIDFMLFIAIDQILEQNNTLLTHQKFIKIFKDILHEKVPRDLWNELTTSSINNENLKEYNKKNFFYKINTKKNNGFYLTAEAINYINKNYDLEIEDYIFLFSLLNKENLIVFDNNSFDENIIHKNIKNIVLKQFKIEKQINEKLLNNIILLNPQLIDQFENEPKIIEKIIKTRNYKIYNKFVRNLNDEVQIKTNGKFIDMLNIIENNNNNNNKGMIVHSHIIPYSETETNEQAADNNNGLILPSIYDALFDKNIISFDKNGNIIESKICIKNKLSSYINLEIKLDSKYLTSKRIDFLIKHNISFNKIQ